jgi:hypothetical protein
MDIGYLMKINISQNIYSSNYSNNFTLSGINFKLINMSVISAKCDSTC